MVCPLIRPIFDGVSFDQTDIDDFIRGYKKGLVEEEEEDKANKVNKVNKATVGSKESPSSFPPTSSMCDCQSKNGVSIHFGLTVQPH